MTITIQTSVYNCTSFITIRQQYIPLFANVPVLKDNTHHYLQMYQFYKTTIHNSVYKYTSFTRQYTPLFTNVPVLQDNNTYQCLQNNNTLMFINAPVLHDSNTHQCLHQFYKTVLQTVFTNAPV